MHSLHVPVSVHYKIPSKPVIEDILCRRVHVRVTQRTCVSALTLHTLCSKRSLFASPVVEDKMALLGCYVLVPYMHTCMQPLRWCASTYTLQWAYKRISPLGGCTNTTPRSTRRPVVGPQMVHYMSKRTTFSATTVRTPFWTKKRPLTDRVCTRTHTLCVTTRAVHYVISSMRALEGC